MLRNWWMRFCCSNMEESCNLKETTVLVDNFLGEKTQLKTFVNSTHQLINANLTSSFICAPPDTAGSMEAFQ